MAKQNKKVSDKYVKEAIDEYNNGEQDRVFDSLTNHITVNLNGREYIVVGMAYKDFVKLKGGIDMEDLKWTNP